MKKGDTVNIVCVKTDVTDCIVPCELLQDGPKANVDGFSERIYFKQVKNVTVHYFFNATGEQRVINLKHLKDVSVASGGFFLMIVLS